MLLESQIQVGTVAYFAAKRLYGDLRITRNFYASTDIKTRPYVCIGEHDGESAWYALTSKFHPLFDRLPIEPEWRLRGSEAWRSTPCYLNNVHDLFSGPNAAFTLACSEELGEDPSTRPQISRTGILAIKARMAASSVRLPWSIDP